MMLKQWHYKNCCGYISSFSTLSVSSGGGKHDPGRTEGRSCSNRSLSYSPPRQYFSAQEVTITHVFRRRLVMIVSSCIEICNGGLT
jgi:hypothetical protein